MIARTMAENLRFHRGITLFNGRKFFEAHEAWEEIWLAETELEKTFLQGLIQLAAAFHHQARGNTRGMRSLLAAGLAKLERFPANHRGIDLANLCEAARDWAKDAGEGGRTLRKLPRITKLKRAAR